MNKSLTIIIPCFNEEEVLEESYRRLKKVLDGMNIQSEVIFINDGSTDSTICILSHLAEIDTRVKVISFSRNFGHQKAVSAGINNCTTDMAVIIDADLQDPPVTTNYSRRVKP